MKKKKILFLLGMYHPHYSANGLCVKNVVDECVDSGFDVTCIVNSYYGEDDICTVDGAKLYRIKAKLFDRVDQWYQNNTSNKNARLIKKISLVLNKLKLFLLAPVWPRCSPIYTHRFYKKAKQLCKKEHFDAVVSVYTPISSLLAGYYLKRKNPDIEFIPYFLDSLSGGYGPRQFSKSTIIKRGLKIESKVFEAADKIIIMNSAKEHQHQHNSRFKDKLVVLDIPMLAEVERIEAPSADDKITLLFVGSLNRNVRNPQAFIGALKGLDSNVHVELVGNIQCKEMFDELKSQYKDRLVFTSFVSHDELKEKYSQAHVLVNIGNLVSTMVPSKIFEYMSYGKPIVSTYDIEDEPSKKYLEDYPLALLLSSKDGAAENSRLLQEFLSDAVNKNVPFETIKNRFYLNTPEAVVNQVLGD